AGLTLTLDDAVRGAIGNNLSLKAEAFNPAISGTDVRRARAIYNPRFSVLLDHRGANSPASQTFPVFSISATRVRFFDANISTDVLLPTGATASASFTNLWRQDNLETFLSRFAQPNLTLSFSQPLLQRFGREITEREITVATFATESALVRWRAQALSVSGNTRDQYFALIKARQNLQTRKASLALAREIHASNEARVRAGVLAAIELLDSRLGVAQREKDLLEAEKNALDEADKLRVLLHLPFQTDFIVPEAFPEAAIDRSEENALRKALAMRPDLLQARTNLKSQEFSEKVGRNLLLPSLSLKGSAGLTALAPDYATGIDDLRTGKFPLWSVGIELAYPLGNDAAEADLAKNRLQAGQSRVQIQSLEESAGLEVRQAIRNLETREKQIAVANRGVELAEARFDSYVKRGKVGLSTTRDILQVESDLTVALEGLAGARSDYQVAVTQLWKSTGELLERHGIRIEEKDIEYSAWKEIR
ncbi:MAG: TolC family protein, partial [Candidatus Deferrimicrobiota bacterium]